MSERKATRFSPSGSPGSDRREQQWLLPEAALQPRPKGCVPGLFAWERGLFLLPSRIALDVTRPQAMGFISHAHMDHAARHNLAFCTHQTALLVRHRLGQVPMKIMRLGEAIELAGQRLTALPAGHVLGSAMLFAEHDRGSLLYTGDFRLGPSATAAPAQLRQADYLIMECTFGHPRFRLPAREVVVEMLVDKVSQAIRRGATPVISAYVLGKAQEVTRILTAHGITVLQHPQIYRVSQVYEEAGCPLGDFRRYEGRPVAGTAVVVPPGAAPTTAVPGALHVERFQVTGWANDPARRRKVRAEHWIPLSDHADFDQLLSAVEQVSPKAVFCAHGPKSFVQELRSRGWDARWGE